MFQSLVIDKQRNLERVEHACSVAAEHGARMVVMPELMLSGHAGHPMMVENAEEVPDGPQAQAVLELSRKQDLCVCVGIAERCGSLVFNSQFVVDRGRYLGLQRKINLSRDEYLWFGWGEEIPVSDIGEVRFGIVICYDNLFPEYALALGMQDVDLILAVGLRAEGREVNHGASRNRRASTVLSLLVDAAVEAR